MSYRPIYTSAPLGLIVTADPGPLGYGRPQTLALIERIDASVASLARDIARNEATIRTQPTGASFLTNWHGFKQRWTVFAGANRDAWFPSGTQTLQYAHEYNALETQYTALTGSAPSRADPVTIRPPGEGSSNPMLIVGVAAGVGLVGLIGVGYLMSSVAKIYQARAVLRNPRRRPRKNAGTAGPGTRGWSRSGGLYRFGDWAWDGSAPHHYGFVWRFKKGTGDMAPGSRYWVHGIDEANDVVNRSKR